MGGGRGGRCSWADLAWSDRAGPRDSRCSGDGAQSEQRAIAVRSHRGSRAPVAVRGVCAARWTWHHLLAHGNGERMRSASRSDSVAGRWGVADSRCRNWPDTPPRLIKPRLESRGWSGSRARSRQQRLPRRLAAPRAVHSITPVRHLLAGTTAEGRAVRGLGLGLRDGAPRAAVAEFP